MRDYIIIAAFLISLVSGQLLWKLAINHIGGIAFGGYDTLSSFWQLITNVYFLMGCVAYLAAVTLWFYLLSKFDFSYIYPFTALLYVASLLGARLVLGESIPSTRWLAVGVICIGVILLGRT